MFGNDTYTDQTNSNVLRKFVFLLNRQNYFDNQSAALDFDTQNQQL